MIMPIDTLEREVSKTSKSTQKTIDKVIEVSNQEPLKAVFLTRVIEGLIEIANSSDRFMKKYLLNIYKIKPIRHRLLNYLFQQPEWR